jgi:hypothetical protein
MIPTMENKNSFKLRGMTLGLLLGFAVAAMGSKIPATRTDNQETQVRQFVEAFNAHDSKRMIEMVDEKIQWVSVDGSSTAVETEGVSALQQNMDRYFKSCPSCKSTLEWVRSSSTRVITLERAEWVGKNGAKSQKSIAVYEFRADKISRVYYFPAEVDGR